MKAEAKVLRAKAQKEEFDRRVAKRKGHESEKTESKRNRMGEKEEVQEKSDEEEREMEEEVEESRKTAREEQNEEDEERGREKRVRIEMSEARKALELIEVWVNEVRVEWENAEAQEDEMLEKAWDDVKGGELKIGDVRKARKEEVDYMQKRGIWKVVPIAECWQKTGKGPIGTRWVDTNKGSVELPDVRCRLVARDFKSKGGEGREDLFAATPPAEAERLALSRAVTRCGRKGKWKKRKLMFIDAKKAHLNAPCEGDVYVALPEEAEGGEGVCGKLDQWLYGCRPAAQAWEEFYATRLEAEGFKRGDACGVVFHHAEKDVTIVCHGDDFTIVGEEWDLEWIRGKMSEWFELKVRAVLGPDAKDDKETIILGRTVRWTESGVEFEADPRHRQILAEYFGFTEESAAAAFNGDRERKEDGLNDEADMVKSEATEFRGMVARLNYLAQDSPDLQYTSKEISKEMSRPRKGAWARLKKAVRYLIGRKAVVWKYCWQEEAEALDVKTDSDWGGSRGDRRSTSGGAIMLGSHCIKTWGVTQGAIALSSAEAEFYAMVDGVIRAKWIVSVAKEMGFQKLVANMKLGTDSSAAKSFVCRRGLGKMRHIEIRDLWLQQEVRKGTVIVQKIPGDRNPADLMTKFLHVKDVVKNLGLLRIIATPGNEIKREMKSEKEKGAGTKKRWADADDWGDEEDGPEEVCALWGGQGSHSKVKHGGAVAPYLWQWPDVPDRERVVSTRPVQDDGKDRERVVSTRPVQNEGNSMERRLDKANEASSANTGGEKCSG